MTKTRKMLVGLGVTAALLVPAGAAWAATNDAGPNGGSGHPAAAAMARQQDRTCDGTHSGAQQRQGDRDRQRIHQQDQQGQQVRQGTGNGPGYRSANR